MNPVASGRLRTAETFNFKYGRVEIRARMPKGDWLWPSISLMPRFNAYGNWPASGQIGTTRFHAVLARPAVANPRRTTRCKRRGLLLQILFHHVEMALRMQQAAVTQLRPACTLARTPLWTLVACCRQAKRCHWIWRTISMCTGCCGTSPSLRCASCIERLPAHAGCPSVTVLVRPHAPLDACAGPLPRSSPTLMTRPSKSCASHLMCPCGVAHLSPTQSQTHGLGQTTTLRLSTRSSTWY